MNKFQVKMEPTDAGKILEIELTREHCEGVYALCDVLGRQQDTMLGLGEVLLSIKSGMAEVLRQIPKDFDGIAEVPFTAETAASLLSMCCYLAKNHPVGPHTRWVSPLQQSVEAALRQSGVRCKILLENVPVFVGP
ncbi:MAG: hypothetical protein ACQESR_13370 [Planctomycetota bacterium]